MSDGMEIMKQFIPASPFGGLVGITLDSIEPDRAVLSMPFKPELATTGTLVHGGAIGTLLDTAAMAAAWATTEAPDNLRGTTVGFTVNFLSGANSADLTATATVIRRGKTLCYVEVQVTQPDGKEVARGLATYKLG